MTPWWTNHPSLDANQTPYMANHNSAAAPNPWVTLALTCTTTQIWVMPIQDWLNFGSGEQVSRIPIWKRILAVTWITKEDIELSSQLTNALSCQAMKALCCLRPRSTAIERGLRVEDAQEFATPPSQSEVRGPRIGSRLEELMAVDPGSPAAEWRAQQSPTSDILHQRWS